MILPKLVLAAISYSFSHACYAVNYYYPAGNLTAAVAPQTLASGDTLNINSSTFQTTNSAAYTVNPVRNATINTQAGSTISYAGSNRNASTIFFSATAATTQTYNLSGTISAGTGSYAISFSNTNSSSSTININLYNAVINGNISSLGLSTLYTYNYWHTTNQW